jgi:hypothetical protein
VIEVAARAAEVPGFFEYTWVRIEAGGSRVRFRASRTLSRHRRMRQKRASAGNRSQVIPAISITFPDKWHCAMRDFFEPPDEVE